MYERVSLEDGEISVQKDCGCSGEWLTRSGTGKGRLAGAEAVKSGEGASQMGAGRVGDWESNNLRRIRSILGHSIALLSAFLPSPAYAVRLSPSMLRSL